MGNAAPTKPANASRAMEAHNVSLSPLYAQRASSPQCVMKLATWSRTAADTGDALEKTDLACASADGWGHHVMQDLKIGMLDVDRVLTAEGPCAGSAAQIAPANVYWAMEERSASRSRARRAGSLPRVVKLATWF